MWKAPVLHLAALRSAIILALAAALPLVTALRANADSTVVVLPAEFFFGRWESGGTVGVLSVFEGDLQPHWRTSGEYVSSKYKLAAEAWTGSPYPVARDWSGNGFAAGLHFRPSTSLQFGLDQFLYEESEVMYPGGISARNEDLQLSTSLRFSNSDSIRIPAVFAQHVYAGGNAVGRGHVLNRTYASFHQYAKDRADPNEPVTTVVEGKQRTTVVGSDVTYGLTNRLSIEAGAFFGGHRNTQSDIFFPGTSAEAPVDRVENFDRVGVNAGAAIAVSDAVILNVDVAQQYAQSSNRKAMVFISLPDSTVVVDYWNEDRSWQNDRSGIRGELVHQIRGSFDSRIVLDDYIDYYRHLLFAGQQRSRLAIEYEHMPAPDVSSDKRAMLSVDFARGLPGNVEIGTRLAYIWSGSRLLYYAFGPSSRETIEWAFGLKWRSYDYVPGHGPGWDRDTFGDLVFGPMLPAGEIFFSTAYLPPGWSGLHSGEGGFLSFSDLEGGDVHSIQCGIAFGVFGKSEIGGDFRFYLRTSGPEDSFAGDVAAFVRSLVCGRFEVRAGYEQVYREGYHDNPQVTVSLAGIF